MCLIIGLPDVSSESADPAATAAPATLWRCNPVRKDAIHIYFFHLNYAPGLNPNIVKRIPGGNNFSRDTFEQQSKMEYIQKKPEIEYMIKACDSR
jgi:hypothetical protein